MYCHFFICCFSFIWANIKYEHQFFGNDKSASQAGENVSTVYGSNTITAKHAAKFLFCRPCSGNFGVKNAPRSGRPFVENTDTIMEIESHPHIRATSISQGINMSQRTAWNHLKKG